MPRLALPVIVASAALLGGLIAGRPATPSVLAQAFPSRLVVFESFNDAG